ncbi:MAG: membrane or secreted protein [Pirellulaceae bacterium]
MRICCRLTTIALVAAGLLGCRSDGRMLLPAGSVQKQRSNATMFDPYTDNDIGPEVVGGRPKDYQKPLSDTDRSRLFRTTWLPF